ncbi:MAG: hypothetical protein ACTSWQ_06455 [Candidatus Thorarchaeota archaeon]
MFFQAFNRDIASLSHQVRALTLLDETMPIWKVDIEFANQEIEKMLMQSVVTKDNEERICGRITKLATFLQVMSQIAMIMKTRMENLFTMTEETDEAKPKKKRMTKGRITALQQCAEMIALISPVYTKALQIQGMPLVFKDIDDNDDGILPLPLIDDGEIRLEADHIINSETPIPIGGPVDGELYGQVPLMMDTSWWKEEMMRALNHKLSLMTDNQKVDYLKHIYRPKVKKVSELKHEHGSNVVFVGREAAPIKTTEDYLMQLLENKHILPLYWNGNDTENAKSWPALTLIHIGKASDHVEEGIKEFLERKSKPKSMKPKPMKSKARTPDDDTPASKKARKSIKQSKPKDKVLKRKRS